MIYEPIIIEAAEIEVNTDCPRRCTYCPNSVPELRIKRQMERSVFDRVLEELSKAAFVGRLSFHLYSEPLLRDDLEDLISYARKILPRSFLVLFSNGDLLTTSRYGTLLEAGIDRLFVTRHDARNLPRRPFQEVQFSSALTLTSRAGTVHAVGSPLESRCYAPTEMLIVTVDANVLLCHEDGQKKTVIGNLMWQSLEEVWWSPDLQRMRSLLKEGRRSEASEICRRCDLRKYAIRGNAI